MQYFSEIVCFVLLGCIVTVVILSMFGETFKLPQSELFAGIIGFSMREVAQCLNNHYNKSRRHKDE